MTHTPGSPIHEAGPAAPIIVLDPDRREASQIAAWLRSAGLGMISTASSGDEAMLMLGRQGAGLLIIDDRVPASGERRLLAHIAAGGHTRPALVRLVAETAAAGPTAYRPALDRPALDRPALDRATATEIVKRPLAAHDVVVRVGSAMQRPDLVGRMDRDRDQSAEHLAAARRMQLGLLPTAGQLLELRVACGVGVSGFCRSGEAVGGDFWGAWPTGRGRLALAVADFAGHGLSAALNTFRLHAILSEQTLRRGLPARMTGLLNRRLHALLPRGHYATMIYAQIDPAGRRVAWCSAGGPPPLFVSPGGAVDLPGRGFPLGVRAEAVYRSEMMRLPEPGILCLFSDGLYESGAAAPEIPRAAIAASLAEPARIAAAGHLAEATETGVAALEALRDRHPSPDHSDDVMAVCVAFGPDSGPVD